MRQPGFYLFWLIVFLLFTIPVWAEQDCTMEAATGIPQSECEALFEFYNSTGGDNWGMEYFWDTLDPVASWRGIRVDSGHVVEITIWVPGIEGPLSPALGDLPYLEVLSIFGSDYGGGIPPELGNLGNLRVLDLNENNLSGSIPPELGNLTNLQELNLEQNDLSGYIPEELGNLVNLELLNLRLNRLDGSIPPTFGNLISLLEMNLGHNSLDGIIPSQLGNLVFLQDLDFQDNNLSGAIPPEFGDLSSLRVCRIENNQLSGGIPSTFGDLTDLELLDLSSNFLEDIPPEFGALPKLAELDLGGNKLETIPPQLSYIDSLIKLNLAGNYLRSIPPELGNFGNLRKLYLGNNELVEIAPEFGNMTSLTILDLSHNHLSGLIPPEIGGMTSLVNIYLDGNMLSGPIPVEILNLESLGHTGGWVFYYSRASHNALFTDDPEIKAFMDQKFRGTWGGNNWALYQTIAPLNLQAEVLDFFPPAEQAPGETGIQGSNRLRFSWDPIIYQGDDGGYEICLKETLDGPCIVSAGITGDKEESSLVVSGLKPDTEYLFDLSAKTYPVGTENYNTVTSLRSGAITFRTGPTAVTAFPLWNLKAGTFTGLAFSNYGIEKASLTLVAYDENGQIQGVPVNPSLVSVEAGMQLARLGTEFFGVTEIDERISWVEAASDQAVGSFFTFGSSDMRMLDGAVTQDRPSRKLYFARPNATAARLGQEEPGLLTIILINPMDSPVELDLSLIRDGYTIGEVNRTINAKGLLAATAGELFGSENLPEDLYLEVKTTSGMGVIGFSRVDFPETGTTLAFNAAEPSSAETLYSAQLASGPGAGGSGMETHIRLLNPMKNPRQVTFTAIANDGTLLAEPVTRTLCSQCVMETGAWDLFAFGGDSAIGSLVIDVNAGGVIGDVVFTPFNGIEYAAAMPLQARPVTEAVFNHIANSDEIYTGLAFFNPSEEESQITVITKKGDGTVSGTRQFLLGPGERLSRTLKDQDMLPETASQLDGFISISSTQPIICQQLFGGTGLQFLAAVPPSTSYTTMF
jgi:Leucine-rich repeat (LRR) protein